MISRGVVMSQQADVMPDSGEFADLTEPFRRELLAHCYRMLGSVDDAEDLVQETYLRAWRSYGGFEGRSSVRTWLYQIATNACLTDLQRRGRRPLPSGLGGPGENPEVPLAAARSDVAWLQPIPDALVTPESRDPAIIVASRESLRLALIASLQYLPPRQRAVLILRDVLAFPAAEVAELLGVTTVAVKSTLQRARARLEQVAPAADQVTEPAEPERRALLDRYIAAFENADPAALEQLLRQDATLELPPSAAWFAGGDAVAHAVSGLGSPGEWRMIPTSANGQPAAAAYRRSGDGTYLAYGIVVLTATTTGIARLVVFGDPGLFPAFGLPPIQPAAATAPPAPH
jgi:RNA polymerase sigma-70 factor (ECF subfamily)